MVHSQMEQWPVISGQWPVASRVQEPTSGAEALLISRINRVGIAALKALQYPKTGSPARG